MKGIIRVWRLFRKISGRSCSCSVLDDNFRKGSWAHGSIGCVRIDCRSGDVKWVVQPDEGHRKKLVVVMETGPVKIETHMSGRNSAA
ncbi:hypothetical protein GQ600_18298 [Phytophthora cactorum]|nr:hypothetical protein GQ600_18298 [Phytophthora cactorum]